MKKSRTTLLLFALFSFFIHAYSQVIPVKNGLQTDIAKAISDYPNHFKNITGDLIVANPQSTDYRSLLIIKGSEECTVTKYSASGKEIYSWQALMLKTEDFEQAAKKFKAYYNSLQNLSANTGSARYVFKADYESPAEEKKFTSIIFKNSKEQEPTSKLRVELLMENELLEWVIRILVYDVEREDNERGPEKEQ